MKVDYKMEEIKIIKEQIKNLVDGGYIFEARKGVYFGLGINDTFCLKIRGGIK